MHTIQLATRTSVLKALTLFSIHFPEAGYREKQLNILSHTYTDALWDMKVTEEELTAITKIALKHSRFFPKIADLLDALSALRKQTIQNTSIQKYQKLKAIPPHNKKSRYYLENAMTILNKRVSGEYSEQEAKIALQQFSAREEPIFS